jgi:hypothetical protein
MRLELSSSGCLCSRRRRTRSRSVQPVSEYKLSEVKLSYNKPCMYARLLVNAAQWVFGSTVTPRLVTQT